MEEEERSLIIDRQMYLKLEDFVLVPGRVQGSSFGVRAQGLEVWIQDKALAALVPAWVAGGVSG